MQQVADGTFAIDPSAFESSGTVATCLELARMHSDANLSTLVAETGLTAAQELFNLVVTMNNEIRETEQRWGLRPDRVSFFTAYDFTRGRLKGFTIGGGYRWRSANICGSSRGGMEMKGRAITAADLLLRYKRRLSDGPVRGNLVFQVNVMNLFDQSGIIPKHISSTTDFQIPRRPRHRLQSIRPRRAPLRTFHHDVRVLSRLARQYHADVSARRVRIVNPIPALPCAHC